MDDWRHVTGNERGVLRVFAIDLPAAEVAAFTAESTAAWPLRDALGVTTLDHEFVEVFDLDTIRTYGFARYLSDANGMDDAEVTADAAMLDGLTGHVAIVSSNAFGGQAATLSPSAPLRLVATYRAERATTPTETLHAATAKRESAVTDAPTAPKPPRSEAATGGRIALYALLAAAALVLLMIWIAG